MAYFYCPFLNSDVELTEERERHIAARHPDLLPQYYDCLAETLLSPDQVRRSKRLSSALLFCRWFGSIRGGKYVIVVVMNDDRKWIITAYISSTSSSGEIIWQAN